MGHCPLKIGAMPEDNIFLRIRAVQAKLRAEIDASPSLAQKRSPLVHPAVAEWRNNNADLDALVIRCNGSVTMVARVVGVSYQAAYNWKHGSDVAPRHAVRIRNALYNTRPE